MFPMRCMHEKFSGGAACYREHGRKILINKPEQEEAPAHLLVMSAPQHLPAERSGSSVERVNWPGDVTWLTCPTETEQQRRRALC